MNNDVSPNSCHSNVTVYFKWMQTVSIHHTVLVHHIGNSDFPYTGETHWGKREQEISYFCTWPRAIILRHKWVKKIINFFKKNHWFLSSLKSKAILK